MASYVGTITPRDTLVKREMRVVGTLVQTGGLLV